MLFTLINLKKDVERKKEHQREEIILKTKNVLKNKFNEFLEKKYNIIKNNVDNDLLVNKILKEMFEYDSDGKIDKSNKTLKYRGDELVGVRWYYEIYSKWIFKAEMLLYVNDKISIEKIADDMVNNFGYTNFRYGRDVTSSMFMSDDVIDKEIEYFSAKGYEEKMSGVYSALKKIYYYRR